MRIESGTLPDFFIMKTFVNFAELFVGNVGIDLGSGDRGVAKHRLDRTDVGAITQ